jgi:hypothetical protein
LEDRGPSEGDDGVVVALLRGELFDGVVVGWWMGAGPLVGGGVGAIVEADVGRGFC